MATPLDCALGLPFVTYELGDRAEVCVGLGTDLDLSYGGGCAELVCCSCLLARGGAPPGPWPSLKCAIKTLEAGLRKAQVQLRAECQFLGPCSETS